jgi:hypothetical protein
MFEFLTNLMSGGSGTTTIGPGSMSHMSPDQWGTQVQNPSGGGGVGELLADPNIQSLMAGIGAGLAPEGVGGAVGKATQGMIQNKQMGKAMEKQDARWTALIEAMAGGKVGSASIKTDPKGGTSVSLKAPENGLGTLSQPMQQTPAADVSNSPFTQYMNNMQQWFQKFGGM